MNHPGQLSAAFVMVVSLVASAAAQEPASAVPDWLTAARPQLNLDAAAETAADDDNELRTDRDAYTFVPTTARFGETILESSFSYIDNPGFASTYSFPELLVRVGVNDWMEARLGWNYDIGGINDITGMGSIGGLISPSEANGSFLFGTKIRLLENEGRRPAASIMMHGQTPTSGGDNTTDPSASAVLEWKVQDDWLLALGLHYQVLTDPDDYYNEWTPSMILRIPVGERWNVHAEWFSNWTVGRQDEERQHYVSPGGHVAVTENFEIGLRFVIGLSPGADSFVANTGIALRF